MNKYIHKIAGIYNNGSNPENTRDLLIEHGFQLDQTNILLPTKSTSDEKIVPMEKEIASPFWTQYSA